MLIGYISDENYLAIPGVDIEIEPASTPAAQSSRDASPLATRSTASGAIHADIQPGRYEVVLNKSGYTGKRVEVDVTAENPIQFRLLTDRMYGFMWPKWVKAGETSEYCVHSTEEFRLDLWRYGWEKEFIRSYGWCSEHGPRAMTQILPDEDFTQTGVQWNRTGYTLEFQKHGIIAPEKSGLYFLHATTRKGEMISFPWTVSPAPTSKSKGAQASIAVLSSTISQNAYNSFGGRSNYFNQDALPPRPIVNSRQDVGRYTSTETWPFEITGAPLSFQRPEPVSHVPAETKITDTIPGRVESCFAGGEWRLLGWMEREGFEYDLYSETDLHFGGLNLDDYQVLVLNNHHEYWTPEMYFRTKEWVQQRGGKVLYLGGCGFYAELDFDDESTMRCRREGIADLRKESEANLSGVAYTHGGFQSGAPFKVLNDSHWVFADTGLKKGDLFGLQSLHERVPGGASAHELDKISPDSPANIVHLAKGTNANDEGADCTIYETDSAGAVFAASSLCWTLSLPVDDGISKVTSNVLKRFLNPDNTP